jgi:hypothetical protein
MIYFIKDTGTQAIKIGHSARRPEDRIGELQTGNPHKLQLLGTVPGTECDEVRYHDQFAAYRLEGEWFQGDIIEDVLTIIAESKQPRIVIRRRTMSEAIVTPGEPLREESEMPGNGTLDKDTGILGICRIPGLKMKRLTLKLTERPNEDGGYQKQNGHIYCGAELQYLLEFESDVTDVQVLHQLRTDLLGNQGRVKHVFLDEDNAVIPFSPQSLSHHIVGGSEAITGVAGEAVRVLVVWEKSLAPKHHGAKIKSVFMGENYTGEHPLKKAKKMSVSIR